MVASLLCPASFEITTREVPLLRWWAMNVCLRSLTLVPSIPAILKYLSMAVLIFLTKRGLPFFVMNRVSFSLFGLISRYSFRAA